MQGIKRIRPVVLAGGFGKRLRPLSTLTRPKQFLSFFTQSSFYDKTLMRVSDGQIFLDPVVVSHESLDHRVKTPSHKGVCLFEPASKNTAISIGLAVCHSLANNEDDEVLLIMPSDHVIHDAARFNDDMRAAFSTAMTGHICLFGIKPDKPNDRFGYIERNEETNALVKFHEKPSRKKAKEYINQGYVWNSGIVLARADVLKRECEKHAPDLWGKIEEIWAHRTQQENSIHFQNKLFQDVRSVSVDVAIMEKTKNARCHLATFDWSDIGSWSALCSYVMGEIFKRSKPVLKGATPSRRVGAS